MACAHRVELILGLQHELRLEVAGLHQDGPLLLDLEHLQRVGVLLFQGRQQRAAEPDQGLGELSRPVEHDLETVMGQTSGALVDHGRGSRPPPARIRSRGSIGGSNNGSTRGRPASDRQ